MSAIPLAPGFAALRWTAPAGGCMRARLVPQSPPMNATARALVLALACSAGLAFARAAEPAKAAATGDDAARPAPASAQSPAPVPPPQFVPPDPGHDDATLTVLNRPVVVFRAPFLGVKPEDRAAAALARVRTLFQRGGKGLITVADGEKGVAVLVDGQLAFVVSNEDAQPIPGATAHSIAEDAVKVLEQLAAETREARDSKFLLGAGVHAAIATLVWLALMWLARVAWRVSTRWVMGFASRLAEHIKVGGTEIIPRVRAGSMARALMSVLGVATMLLLTWNWLGYALGLFPYTRPWSEGLTGFLVDSSLGLLVAIAHALPSLFIAVVIFVIAWMANRAQKRFFARVEAGYVAFGSIDRDTAPATRRLATLAIWLFAAAMAYPYIPGSDTDAFKGLSVLLGLMVSVGASGIVGQAMSGLILMYTRTFRTGEYVRIGDREGTLTRMGMFTSTVRTGLGEELTIPNSQVLTSVTTNYSRIVEGPGFMIGAKVSIGYDAPWRQVHAMLIEAAERTEGILDAPPPEVFQTALDDFYVQYRLICQASPLGPRDRAAVISALHAAIQDVFNEHGVQIMSPHYLGDPAEAKVVPRSRWYVPPARREGGESSS